MTEKEFLVSAIASLEAQNKWLKEELPKLEETMAALRKDVDEIRATGTALYALPATGRP
ncbi:hypothetical protein [Chitinophaga nivalis]|uniref:SlyX protein n=1 Tax=Chitinophaga nivalis TaxID=2991709 RepID=A0ABT3IWY9_9BACT|nr:hypothetical protein [Chitinophaga nivalis]MCW3461809.1 hypothetical protein [Chitinophaga nivalis]MCW3488497.1 hypothetical protein [Chitinophaga nivalis]